MRKEQSAFEFITTYGWAILILAVVITMLYYFVGIPSTAAPNQCQFLYGTNCQGVIATSHGGTTKVTMVITNSQSYPLLNPMIKFATDAYGNVSAACLPAGNIIQPGGEMICNMTLSEYVSPGTTLTGTTYLNVTACPSGNINNCQPKQFQIYKGSVITRVTSQSSNIHLTSTSTSTTLSTSTSTSSTSISSTSTTSTSTSTSTSSTTSVSCTPGSQTWTPIFTGFGAQLAFTFNTPAGCGISTTYKISVTGAGGGGGAGVWGAGGAGCYSSGATSGGGGGGGGGGYATGSISGIPSGTTFNVITGEGSYGWYSGGGSYTGPCLVDGETGGYGGISYVQGPTFRITAMGGAGGQETDSPATGQGGAGGSWACTGITCTGIAGQAGSTAYYNSGTYYGGAGGNSGNVLSGSGGPGGSGGIYDTSVGGTGTQGTYGPFSGYLNGGGGGGGGAGDNNQGGAIAGTGGMGVVTISWN